VAEVETVSMSDHERIAASQVPVLPGGEVVVDFGSPAPGSSNPMPENRRDAYLDRIKNSVETQAAGAAKAYKLFIR
jgi:hypothetical protein